jgi:hypothetical protein
MGMQSPIRKFGFRTVRILAPLVVLLVALPTWAQSGATTYTLDNDMIKLANDHYEITFSAEHGGITSILDKSTGQNISEGSVNNNLWSAALDNNQFVDSSNSHQFNYTWDQASSTLTLTYSGTIDAQVTITPSGEHGLKIAATITNKTDANITDFQLPGRLKIAKAEMDDALLPMMPGALISSTFFDEGRSFINEYPGVMFADYLALRSERGKLAVYSARGNALQPALIGYENLPDEPDYTALKHQYQTWIADTTTWEAPAVILTVGQDYPETIAGYRTANGIDQYKSLVDKLGDEAQTYFAAPMYKLDLAALRIKFADIPTQIIDHLNFPGMVHLVAFQPRGHDKNYPDFIPPDTKWGTTEDFTNTVNAIHEAGSLAVPYTNFSWWDANGPTLMSLGEDLPLFDLINIKDSHGLPGFESYGPNSGFVMNQHHPFVQDKITEQHNLFLTTVGVDGIFEDQWGARNSPYDFNPNGLETFDPSTSYFEGILNHYRNNAASNLMTEVGVDALADEGIAFMGTNYLWDMLGYRSATADVTTYYPMAGMLLRDKVLLYQHNLAAETWTKNKDMLRWNLAQGYGLSNAFLAPTGGLDMDNPWLNLIGVFQKYALANYADELVMRYDDLGDNVTQTVFSTYTVHSNWDTENPYSIGGHTLPPDGVVTQANDGSVTGGVFTAYNDQPLSEGDHYLVEVRSDERIQIFQPVGEDTDLTIANNPDWASVSVTAYLYDGAAIGKVEATVEGGFIQFRYSGVVDGQSVGYYEITAGE